MACTDSFAARALKVFPSVTLLLLPLCAGAQTLTITNGIQTYSMLSNTTVTMTGKCELRITATNNPIPGCLINLNSSNAWFFMMNLRPAVVSSSYLPQLRVNGAVAFSGVNIRVVPYAMGTVIIPQPPTYTPLQIFAGPNFLGPSAQLGIYTYYTNATLGPMYRSLGSFKLKRGYQATFAQNPNGTGLSRVFVAQDGDLDIGMMPTNLAGTVSFVRVVPWRWTAKRGWADVGGDNSLLNVYWFYDWGNGHSSSLNSEFVPMKWSGGGSYSGYNNKQNSPHVLGFNEPDKPDQANMTVAAALAEWPNLMQSGLRVGAPGVSDTSGNGVGKSWLYSFMSQADALGYRVDYVPVHAYCPASSASALLSYLQDVYNQTHRPVWLTEFNYQAGWCGGNTPTFEQEATVIGQMIDALEAAPYVERYSIYNWLDTTRQMFTNNVLTPAGLLYRDKPSNLAYTQIIPIAAGNRGIAQLRFEDDTQDSSGYGNHGTAVGIPDYLDGPRGRAIVLDGTNDFVQLPGTIGNSASFSFAGWVYWNGGGNWQRIFDFGSDTSHYLFLTPRSGSGTFRFAINTGSGEQIIQNAGAFPVGQWCHVAFTLTGNTGRLYTNGVQVASGSVTFTPPATNPNKSYLGKSQFAVDPLFSGALDDVQIADYAFTPAQIASLMTNNPPQFLSNNIAGGGADRGVLYTNTVAGAASDPDPGDTIAYSKASGPGWLTVNADGSLMGTPGPGDGGTNYFTLRVTDASGASDYALLTIDLPPVLNPPADGTWISSLSDGFWSDTNKWSGGIVGNGTGFTADFSTLNISADRTVTLDTLRSIGTLKFGDTSGGQNWTLASSDGGALTLDSGSTASPVIFVGQNTATIAAPLEGANGFAKTGAGTLVLDAANSLSGSIFIDTSSTTVNEGIVRITEASAVANITNIWIRNNNSGSSTLQLDGSGASVTIPGHLTVNCRNVAVPTIENLSGSNTLAGLISLDVGGNMFTLQSDAGLLVITATNRYIGSLIGGRNYIFTGNGDHLVTGPILNSVNGAPIGLIKSGSGTLTLAAANTYTNTTSVSGGTLRVNGSIGPGPVTVAGGATLGGHGVIKGAVTIQAFATLSPGGSIGKLTVSNSVTLNPGSATLLELDRSVPTNDVLKVSGLFTRGGVLLITNVGPDLEMGDSFDLFETGSQNGAFTSITLPSLNPGLRWNTNSLAVTGLISVESILPPLLGVSLADGTNLVFQFSSQTGATYVLQSATNLVDVPIVWSNEQTNSGTGALQSFQFPLGDEPQRYFRVIAY